MVVQGFSFVDVSLVDGAELLYFCLVSGVRLELELLCVCYAFRGASRKKKNCFFGVETRGDIVRGCAA